MKLEKDPKDPVLNTTEGAGGGGWSEATDSEMAAAEAAEASYALPHKSKINRGALILLASCVLGIGGIYLFGLKQKAPPPKKSEVESKLDAALAKLVDEKKQQEAQKLFRDTQEMVKAFYEYPTKQQVSLEELQRDPFSRLLSKDNQGNDEAEALKRREQLRKDLEKKLSALKLQSVVQSARGAQCLINGEIYEVGNQVAETFEVRAIAPSGVTLAASDMEFALAM